MTALAADVVAAAINATQIKPSELALGHDLLPVARRFLAALPPGWTLKPKGPISAMVEMVTADNERLEAEIEGLQERIARQALASPELAAAFAAVRPEREAYDRGVVDGRRMEIEAATGQPWDPT
jgi:hypothetical protein